MGLKDVNKLHPTCPWLIWARFLPAFHLSCSSCLPLQVNSRKEQGRGGIMIPPNLTNKKSRPKLLLEERIFGAPAKPAVLSRTIDLSSALLSWTWLPISVPSGRWSISSTSISSGSSLDNDIPDWERSPILICWRMATINMVVQTVLIGSFYTKWDIHLWQSALQSLRDQYQECTAPVVGRCAFDPPARLSRTPKGGQCPTTYLKQPSSCGFHLRPLNLRKRVQEVPAWSNLVQAQLILEEHPARNS